MDGMLGRKLRSERRNTCRYGCCTRTGAHRRLASKNLRAAEKGLWKKLLQVHEK